MAAGAGRAVGVQRVDVLTLDAACARLFAGLVALATCSCASNAPRPWGTLAWWAALAAGGYVAACIVRCDRLSGR